MPNSTKKSDAPESNTPTRTAPNSSCSSVNSTPGSGTRRPLRKRRRVEKDSDQLELDNEQSLNSQLGECNIEDAKQIDRRLRKVARENAISREDMHKVVRSVVRNDHVLALVTLKAEDELAREKREAEAKEEQQRGAIIITETPSVGKLTRAKARELNKTPGITLPPLNDTSVHNEIEALIRDDLHSDEEDEEYTFKEDDFHSDEDPNATASDFDSNPCTPQTPLTANEESPAKFTSDGCFKIPLEKGTSEDPRIATRTRSKLCLQQTTIEDLQSEFVPPDVEEQSDLLEYDMTANDADWMQFLNDFSKPLNNSFLCDDDDLINDPEYVAAEMVPVDAEELRDVNIPKKELTDLVSELFAGLLQEGVSLESIELETPQKFLVDHVTMPVAQQPADPLAQVTRQIDFNVQSSLVTPVTETTDISMDTQSESFIPNVMSTPGTMCSFVPVPLAEITGNCSQLDAACPIVSIPTEIMGQHPPELIAVPLLGQPNCFQLAKVTHNASLLSQEANSLYTTPTKLSSQPQPENQTIVAPKYTEPYDTNFSWKYLSISKQFHSEYQDQFESLRYLNPTPPTAPSNVMGFTQAQHDLLQQQLRIHTQMLTQTFLQTYSHPLLYSMAVKPKQMLQELHERAAKKVSFDCWNLNGAIQLINKWEQDLCNDQYQEENEKMMRFINKEIELTDGHTRQVPRLAPRIMDLMLDSTVFMYPQYLPRMAFQPKTLKFTAFAPSEYQLIAMGLEKHLNAIKNSRQPLRKGTDPLRLACRRMVKDCVHGKEFRRILLKVKQLCDTEHYNPIKYYFAHKRAPPIEHILLGFENGVVRTSREQYHALPSGWKYYIENNWNNEKRARRSSSKPNLVQASAEASASYLDFVREAVGEYILLPNSAGEPSEPDGSVTCLAQTPTHHTKTPTNPGKAKSKPKTPGKSPRSKANQNLSSSLTINVNYVFGGDIGDNKRGAGVSVPFQATNYEDTVAHLNRTLQPSSECSLLSQISPLPPLVEDDLPAVNLCFDKLTQAVRIKELDQSVERTDHTISFSTSGSQKKARFRIFKRHTTVRQQGRRKLALTTRSTSAPLRRPGYHLLRQRVRHKLQKRCQSLISSYNSYLQQRLDKYAHVQSVQFYFRRFLALELYTQFLTDLSMFCENKTQVQANASSPQQQKRQRCEEAARNRRANRHEEMLRHMLQADSPEERNRKDATFAFNFYEKVEEALLSSNRLEDCQQFNHMLQTFDPNKDKVADLYLKVEKLLLPDFPELAEVFLNFLLPAEAAELGKFFEYFMITNASSFINKLNIYFGKQPAQIRKIYACLSELAELPSVSMKKVESKILPLLKGNQFLCDWFSQQFPQAKPPKRVLPPPETINMHEVLSNTSGEFLETIQELPNDVPAQGKPPGCQLRYLNGRIFYGSKVMLPAKLSFRAASIYNEQTHDALSGENLTCAHGVRAHGEKLINAAVAADSDDAAERSEEDDASRALVIDTTTTGDEENSSSSIDMCDDVALRAHAMRLNANYYNSFNNAFSSTPSVGSGNHHSHHHPHAKKTAINFGETSPRRQTSLNVSPLSGVSPLPALASNISGNSPQMDKRKSPSKKVRSPLGQTQSRPRYNVQPMVVIHEPPVRALAAHSPAIECAKRLRTLIDQESSAPEELDSKANIRIIALAKKPVESHVDQKIVAVPTAEVSEQSVPVIEMDVEQIVIGAAVTKNTESTPHNEIVTQYDSDEDCKLDVVATLANSTEAKNSAPEAKENATTASRVASASTVPCSSSAWTREEDKVMLIEMKVGARDRQHLIKRMCAKLKHRNESELLARHQFLIDFLSKLQGK